MLIFVRLDKAVKYDAAIILPTSFNADKLVDEVLFGKLEKGGDVTADYKNSKKSKMSDKGITFTYGKENSQTH